MIHYFIVKLIHTTYKTTTYYHSKINTYIRLGCTHVICNSTPMYEFIPSTGTCYNKLYI